MKHKTLDQNRNSSVQDGINKHCITGEGPQVDVQSVQDLTSLTPLTEDTVLQSIEERFKAGTYYTWAGIPLVAMNPFQEVDGLYDEDMEDKYRMNSAVKTRELPPHIFAIGQKAYSDLKRGFDTFNQSIIISGESGAGKTWTTRTLMQFISDISGKSGCERVSSIEQRILDSNPVLEAFGNACTLRNDNSSRFGKYIQLQFDRENHIVGAKLKTYLLEKTRVVHQSNGEKNFHIFYQISSVADGHKSNQRRRRSSRWGGEDRQAFLETCEAMRNIGIQDELQTEMFKVLKGIKRICKLSFSDAQDELCNTNNPNTAQDACDLLKLDVKKLNKCLNTRRIVTRSTREEFLKPCSLEECISRRDCLAKLIYSRLFEWIVQFINTSIKAPSHSKHAFIGLLDVYGFESFDDNSLEQLCINYANEKLQQHFVCHFLKKQQDEYQKEGIDWNFQEFSDNRHCLDIIEGRVSVFSLMDEECRLNRVADDQGFCDRLNSTLDQNKHFSRLRLSQRSEFIIHHYAASVPYHVHRLIEKNKDHTPPEVMEILQSSNNSFLRQLFENQDVRKDDEEVCKTKHGSGAAIKRPRPSNVTVVSKFKASLDKLMCTLTSTNVHYIRCVRPNTIGAPNVFDRNQVVNQLRSCGVMETIKICAAGYPIRLTHREFINRYNFAVTLDKPRLPATPIKSYPSPCRASESPSLVSINRLRKADRRAKRRKRSGYDHTPSICRSILQTVGCIIDEDKENCPSSIVCHGFKLGRTKLFLREEIIEELEKLRARHQSCSAFTIQCCWRRYKRRLVNSRQNHAAVLIQKVVKGWLAWKRYLAIKRAVVILQKYFRCLLLRKERLVDVTPQDSREALIPTAEKISLPCHVPLHINTCSRPRSSWFAPFVPRGYWSLLMTNPQVIEHNMEINTIHRSSGIASRRRIEHVPVIFHTRKTALTNAEKRPLDDRLSSKGWVAMLC